MSEENSIETPCLAKTTKFEVWSTNLKDTDIIKKKKSTEKNIVLSTKSIRRVIFSDVVLVAINNFSIDLETDEELERNSDHKDYFNAPVLSSTSQKADYYPIEICRAASITLISNIIQSVNKFHSSRLQQIVNLLNDSIVPAISLFEPENDIVNCLIGHQSASFYTPKGFLSADKAFSNYRIKPVKLANSEVSIIRSNTYLWTGAGCLIASAANNLIPIIDCIGALSCDAVGISGDLFDPSLFELYRPHRGQMNSAGNLRMLLEGSKRHQYKHKNVLNSFDLQPFHQIPQINGPALDYFAIAAK